MLSVDSLAQQEEVLETLKAASLHCCPVSLKLMAAQALLVNSNRTAVVTVSRRNAVSC